MLISDGADNAELQSKQRGKLSAEAATRRSRLGVPVNTVSAAQTQSFKDVAIENVVPDEFAFVHNTIEIEVIVEVAGSDTLTVPVT